MSIEFLEQPFYPVSTDSKFLAADADPESILPLVIIGIN
jgi:hypothetical protein